LKHSETHTTHTHTHHHFPDFPTPLAPHKNTHILSVLGRRCVSQPGNERVPGKWGSRRASRNLSEVWRSDEVARFVQRLKPLGYAAFGLCLQGSSAVYENLAPHNRTLGWRTPPPQFKGLTARERSPALESGPLTLHRLARGLRLFHGLAAIHGEIHRRHPARTRNGDRVEGPDSCSGAGRSRLGWQPRDSHQDQRG
jgi:hypothetical protein